MNATPAAAKQSEEQMDVGHLMCEFWDIERKIKALALLFRNFGTGDRIDDAEHLQGIGFFLKEVSQDLGDLISSQLDGREFQDTKSNGK